MGREERPEQHSRIFAHQLDPALPNPPAGSLAGGPNVELQDPSASGLPAGCKPMFCYLGHIDSWSTNEVAINCHQEMTTCAAMASASLAAGPVSRL